MAVRDTLDTERIIDNLITRVQRLEERCARLEEKVAQASSDTRVIVLEETTKAKWELVVEDVDGDLAWLKMKEL